jgi:transcriptional regulator with XRE-family HTH domain
MSEHGFNTVSLAAVSTVSQQTVSRAMRGLNLSARTRFLIAAALNKRVGELFDI